MWAVGQLQMVITMFTILMNVSSSAIMSVVIAILRCLRSRAVAIRLNLLTLRVVRHTPACIVLTSFGVQKVVSALDAAGTVADNRCKGQLGLNGVCSPASCCGRKARPTLQPPSIHTLAAC